MTADLRRYLEHMANVLSDGPNPMKFILAHGREWAVTSETFKGRRYPARKCFMNAAHAAIAGRGVYVEGYATMMGIPIEHAWVADDAGCVIDPTWRGDDEPTRVYFGVPFDLDCMMSLMMESKVYGLLGYSSSRRIFDLSPDEFLPKQFGGCGSLL